LTAWQTRLARFGLALHPEKTRVVEFGRFAVERRKERGEGKPETFDFLGFTHMCGKSRTDGRFFVRRQSIQKRLRAKLQQVKEQLRRRRHDPVPEVGQWLQRVVKGWYNYHAVPCNWTRLQQFRSQVIWLWFRALRRRSERHPLRWVRFRPLIDVWIPRPKILHPWPSVRFAAMHPR